MSKGWVEKLTRELGVAVSNMSKNEKPVIPAWSESLNWATQIGGFKPGKINVLYGAESAGKSLLAMMAIIEMQRKDKEAIAIYFDTEFSFNQALFLKLGGDGDRLVVRKSNDPLKIFDFIGGELLEMLQDGAPVRAIVIDSIAAIRFPKDMRKQTTDMIMGGSGAAYLGSALKLVIPVIAEHQLLTFFVQQVRQQIDPMKALRNPYILPDGIALKHCADLMLEVTRLDTKSGSIEGGETIAGGTAQVGHKVRVKVKKNRMGAPARVAQFTFHYDKGITDVGDEIFELGKSLGVIYHPINPDTGKPNIQSWAFAKYPPVRGEQNMKNFVIGDKQVQADIVNACYKHKDSPVEADAAGFVEDDAEME